jgi:hypothetical protein
LLVILALAASLPYGLGAQSARPDSAPPLIHDIRLQRYNVFADSEATIVLTKLANRFHVTTRADVIRSEMLFRVGEPWDSTRGAETARNLRRLGVFRLVRVDTVHSDSGVTVRVQTQDGWSTKPEFGFRSTGGQVAWRATLIEENLLGTASQLLLSFAEDPDRTTFSVGLRRPRLFANTIGIGFQYDDRSDGHILSAQLYKPYFSLDDRRAWLGSVESRQERILRYFEGEPLPSDTLQRDFASAAASLGWGRRTSLKRYQRWGINGRVWQDQYQQHDSLSGTPTAVGSVGGAWEWRHARYLLVKGFRTTREEDIDLSTSFRVGLSLTPELFGYEENGVVPGISARVGGVLSRKAFGYFDLNAHGRFTAAGLDSGMVQVAGTALFSPFERQAFIVHAWAGWLDNPRPGGEFDLGLGLGPRGFRLHAFSGDRGVFTTAEYRYLVGLDWFQVLDLGVAGFVDYGGAWYAGSPARTGVDFGIGLRVGFSRANSLEMNRIDLVRRAANDVEPAGWLLVIGRGFVFSTAGILNR